jgi:hypothetical protein
LLQERILMHNEFHDFFFYFSDTDLQCPDTGLWHQPVLAECRNGKELPEIYTVCPLHNGRQSQ